MDKQTKKKKWFKIAMYIFIIGLISYVGIDDYFSQKTFEKDRALAFEKVGKDISELVKCFSSHKIRVMYRLGIYGNRPQGTFFVPYGSNLVLQWKGGGARNDTFWLTSQSPSNVSIVSSYEDTISIIDRTEPVPDNLLIMKNLPPSTADITLAIKNNSKVTHLCKLKIDNLNFKVANWVNIETSFVWKEQNLGSMEIIILPGFETGV